MNLTNFKEEKQREILKLIGEKLIEMSNSGYETDVEITLEILQESYLNPLGEDDFFGTEGWEHWLGLD